MGFYDDPYLPPGVSASDPHFNATEDPCRRCGAEDGCDCDPEPDDLGPDAMDLAREASY